MGPKVEDALVRELAEQLRSKGYKHVWTHRKPSSSRGFVSAIEARLEYVPILQPEIDLCMRLDDGRLVAVEVKLFKGAGPTYATPFYEGIGQALALHRYGFDHCALWFLFEDGAPALASNRYGAEAWSFVRNDLCLPLDFTYMAVENDGSRNVFNIIQYTERQDGFSLGPIDASTFVLTWKHSNPIRHSPVQEALRATLDEWL